MNFPRPTTTRLRLYRGTRPPRDAAKPSIVFVHGSANDHSVDLPKRLLLHITVGTHWRRTPGHGRSFGAPKPSTEAVADWIVNLLDNGIQSAVLVGHSMGSLAALDYAARHAGSNFQGRGIGCGVPMAVSDAHGMRHASARTRPSTC